MEKLATYKIPRPDPDTLANLPRHPIVVLLDNVRSIYNVGGMFRTSDAMRIKHLYLTGITGTPEHDDLHKTALGAQDTVPWSHHEDPEPVIDHLREKGYTIAALEITDAPTAIEEIDASHFPLCMIVGNEVHGVQQSLIDRADIALELPQYGAKQSLNVGVAYGIAAYELVQTYRQLEGARTVPSAKTPIDEEE